jgi:hypothetical protein
VTKVLLVLLERKDLLVQSVFLATKAHKAHKELKANVVPLVHLEKKAHKAHKEFKAPKANVVQSVQSVL